MAGLWPLALLPLPAAPQLSRLTEIGYLHTAGKWHVGRGGPFHFIVFCSLAPAPPGLLPATLFAHRPRLTLILSPFASVLSQLIH